MKVLYSIVIVFICYGSISSFPRNADVQVSSSQQDSDNRIREEDADSESIDSLEAILNNIGQAGLEAAKKADLPETVIGTGKALLGIVNQNVKKAISVESKLQKEAEELFNEITAGIEKTDELYKAYAEPALKAILQNKQSLKFERIKLNEIVHRVKFTLQNVKASAQSIFNGEVTNKTMIEKILNHDVTQMQNLIKETSEIIDNAQKIYHGISASYGELQVTLLTYKSEVQKIVDDVEESIATHEKRVEISRGSIYSSCVASSTTCIVLDALMITWGLCGAINAGVCIPLVATLELAAYGEGSNYDILLERADRAYKVAAKIHDEQKAIEEYLKKEVFTLGRLDAALTSAKYSLDLSETMFMNNFPTQRKRYIDSLDQLDAAAQAYLDQAELE